MSQGAGRAGGRYRYPLTETPEPDDETRTRRNIEDADGTPIPNQGALDGGTASTADRARQIGKPCLIVALEEGIDWAAFRDWLDENRIAVLNVAGPRESQRPGVYEAAVRGLEAFAGRVPARGRPLYTPCALPESGLPRPFTVGA